MILDVKLPVASVARTCDTDWFTSLNVDGKENQTNLFDLGFDANLDQRIASIRFDPVKHQRYLCPVGWSGDDMDHGDELGEIMLTNSHKFVSASTPTVMACGDYTPVDISDWVSEINRELESGQIYFGWDLAVAQK
ncbi:hypothetical protein C8R44DRAFT_728093 [Mycena epipterygia]|nr:hypothetical protein C8R44DRAFT_728093 [Mycena epipterygia]